MAKLIITGGAGFIGSCFVREAVARGDDVFVIDALTYAGHEENLTNVRDKIQLVIGDICDGNLVAQTINEFAPDVVINFAAESHVDNSIEEPADFIQTNIVGTYTLLEATRSYWNGLKNEAKKSSFRFLQISTDEVYGSLGDTGKFSESTSYSPNSPYSASKAAADHLVNAWHHTYGLPTIITNCSNNYGPRQHPEKLIPTMILSALDGKKLPVYGDGKNVRDWIHVEDHCTGVYLALTKGNPGETYVFGGHAEMQNIDVVTSICEMLDALKPKKDGKSYKEQISFVKDRLGHDRRYAIDDSKAKSKLGFTRNHDFASGLRATVEWYLDNQDWRKVVLEKRQKAAYGQ